MGLRLNLCRFRGKFAGRDLLVEYRFRLFPRGRRPQDELEIRIPVIQKFWLRLITRSAIFPNEENLSSEEEVPGSPFLAHSNQPEAARLFLETSEIQEQTARLGAVTRLEIYRGTFRALYQKAPDRLYRSTFQDALEAIVRMVDAYERQLALKLTVVRVTELCPYCRERLNPETETIVKCTQCLTRVHHACWNENRHCTTWGCTSTVAQPT
jgi:Prokaryotic RING finger family 1